MCSGTSTVPRCSPSGATTQMPPGPVTQMFPLLVALHPVADARVEVVGIADPVEDHLAAGDRAVGRDVEAADVEDARVVDVERLLVGREAEPVRLGEVVDEELQRRRRRAGSGRRPGSRGPARAGCRRRPSARTSGRRSRSSRPRRRRRRSGSSAPCRRSGTRSSRGSPRCRPAFSVARTTWLVQCSQTTRFRSASSVMPLHLFAGFITSTIPSASVHLRRTSIGMSLKRR